VECKNRVRGPSAVARSDLRSCRLGNWTFGKFPLGKWLWESTRPRSTTIPSRSHPLMFCIFNELLINEFLPQTQNYNPDVVDLWYFKLWILIDQKAQVWNIKGLRHQVSEKLEFVAKTFNLNLSVFWWFSLSI